MLLNCCSSEAAQSTLPRLEIVVDHAIQSIPDIQLIDGSTGAIIGSSSWSGLRPEECKVDVVIQRPETTVASDSDVVATEFVQQSVIQPMVTDAIPTDPVLQHEPDIDSGAVIVARESSQQSDNNSCTTSLITGTPESRKRKVTVTDISPLPTVSTTHGPRKRTKGRTTKAAIYLPAVPTK